MQTVSQSKGMLSLLLRSSCSSSLLVRLADTMLDICSRLGLSVSLEMVRISRVNTHRRMFLQRKHFRKETRSFLKPEREHHDDIIVTVVKISVAEDAEHDDDVEDDDQGGDGRVSGHPGPGHAPVLSHLKWRR